jgi:hypothetical protein
MKELLEANAPILTQHEEYLTEILELALSLLTPEQHEQLIWLVGEEY